MMSRLTISTFGRNDKTTCPINNMAVRIAICDNSRVLFFSKSIAFFQRQLILLLILNRRLVGRSIEHLPIICNAPPLLFCFIGSFTVYGCDEYAVRPFRTLGTAMFRKDFSQKFRLCFINKGFFFQIAMDNDDSNFFSAGYWVSAEEIGRASCRERVCLSV